MKRQRVLAMGAIFFCTVSTMVVRSAGAEDAPSALKLGGFFTLSGAVTAPEHLWGTEIAIDEINAKGGVNGIKFELVTKDHQCAADKMRPVQQSAIASKIIAGLVACTGPVAAAAPLATQEKIPMINIGGQDPALKELGPYILSALVLSDVTAKVAVDYIANELKLKKIAIIYANNPIGNSLQKAMEVAVKGTSVSIVGAFSFDGQQQDFGAILSRVSQAGPDVVYLATNGTPTAQIIKQSREQGLQFPFVSYVGVYGEIAKIAGAALNGLVWTSPQLDTASEAYKSYAAAYQKAHPASQSSYVDVTAHDAVYIIASALATSAKKGGSWWTGERVRNEIIGVSSFSDLAGGSYLFQQDGTVLRPVQLYRQAATGPELIKTYKLDDLKKLN